MSSNRPVSDLAVILVTYNSAAHILACLQSLQPAAADAALQVIVVDNASGDSTLALLQEFSQENPPFAEFRIITNSENRGFTAAVNQGLALADAALVLFLNPDTVLPEGGLVQLRQILLAHPEAGVVAPQLRYPDGRIQPSCRRFPRHAHIIFSLLGLAHLFPKSRLFNGWKMGDFDHRRDAWVEQPQGAFLLARREVVDAVGPWDEGFPMFFSDVDWCQRVHAAGYRIRFTAAVQVVHRQGHSVLRHRPRMIVYSHRSFIRYFWRHHRGGRWLLPNLLVSILLVFSGGIRFIVNWLRSRNG